MASRPAYGYAAPTRSAPSPYVASAPASDPRMAASRTRRDNYVPTPAPPKYPDAGGAAAGASTGQLDTLYRSLLDAVRRQPLPANTSGYANQGAAAYNQALGTMQSGYGSLGQMQSRMQQALNPQQWAEQEAALLAEANYRQPSQTVLLYGMQ